MSRVARRNRTGALKATVALAAIKDEMTLSELAGQFDVHDNQIAVEGPELLQGPIGILGTEAKANQGGGRNGWWISRPSTPRAAS